MHNGNTQIVENIKQLKERRNAIILAHNYQPPEVQDIADIVGDSLELAYAAGRLTQEVILFCGVRFMAETAAIVSPEKRVLLPDENAGCPLADMITVRQLEEFKKSYPDAVVVCYVNSSAEVKAVSDICCTSANAVAIVESLPPDVQIIFLPDRNLGSYTAQKTGRELILWQGFCPTHIRITQAEIMCRKSEYPNAKVVVHPECSQEVRNIADLIGSTSQILQFCCETEATEIIIGTENNMIHRIAKDCPDKTLISVTPFADCHDMRLATLEKVVWSLEDMVYPVVVEEEVAEQASRSIERMLSVSATAKQTATTGD